MKKILVVEDRDTTMRHLKRHLEREGYEVYTAHLGREAIDIIGQHHVDLVLLDLKLPDMNGLCVCNEFRSAYPKLPIIIVSIQTGEREKVSALQQCADDYIAKPFYTSELLQRIKNQFLHTDRMRAGAERRKFKAGPLEINFVERQVRVNGESINLTYTEYEMLYVLVTNAGRTVTYDIIASKIWGDEDISERQNIHVHVNRLRKKIETPENRFIFNEAKIGYRFQAGE
ncbi:MAG TPA: response regulator transcription factor [Ktedonobacteraceae bacterium]|nr:response regulator transcription factor [Ktedonobacteraceae bacterium]